VPCPLSEAPDHLHRLCDSLDLGNPTGSLRPVYGGFHHRMWRLESAGGCYAVKQLAPDVDFTSQDTARHYNVTETAGETFAGLGIPAVFALRNAAGYLQVIEGAGYLVYPWTDAVALEGGPVPEQRALQVARLLALMHRADISVPGIAGEQHEPVQCEATVELVLRAEERHIRQAALLHRQLPDFLDILERQDRASAALAGCTVVCHGDLDQKNVLWDTDAQPLLIDWESARKMNPTYEILLEALDWSGIGSSFDRGLFVRFLSAYERGGGAIDYDSLPASFHCILGDWISWLMYNVARSVDLRDREQRAEGAGQLDMVMSTIVKLQQLLPELLDSVAARPPAPG
jgi:aminoglycoside phosphotransferase (APT) family kinase protein